MYETDLTQDQIILDRIRLNATEMISPYVAQSMQFEHWVDHMTNSMIYKLQAEMLGHRIAKDRWEVKEKPKYESWKDAWMDTFPRGSFRRRWLEYYFGHEVRKTVTTHIVETDIYYTFPEATMAYPKHLGPFHQMITIAERDRYE